MCVFVFVCVYENIYSKNKLYKIGEYRFCVCVWTNRGMWTTENIVHFFPAAIVFFFSTQECRKSNGICYVGQEIKRFGVLWTTLMMVNTNNLPLIDFIMKHFVYICMPFIQKYLHFRRRRRRRRRRRNQCRRRHRRWRCYRRIWTIREAEHVHTYIQRLICLQLFSIDQRVLFVCLRRERSKRS